MSDIKIKGGIDNNIINDINDSSLKKSENGGEISFKETINNSSSLENLNNINNKGDDFLINIVQKVKNGEIDLIQAKQMIIDNVLDSFQTELLTANKKEELRKMIEENIDDDPYINSIFKIMES